jgi:hypothetical protein
VLVAFNTSTAPINVNVEVDVNSASFTSLHGACAPKASAPGAVSVQIPALDYVVCASGTAQ